MNIRDEWRQLSASIDELEREIEYFSSLCPSPRMCRFLIVAEDHRLGKHTGVDFIALCRAVWKTLFYGKRQGASTIAMQLTRTITGNHDRTVRRKALEMLLAPRLTRYVSKERLPLLYLWCGYYGWKMNGFQQACQRLDLDPSSMTLQEDAELVARLKYPQPRECNSKRMKTIRARGQYLIERLDLHDPGFPR